MPATGPGPPERARWCGPGTLGAIEPASHADAALVAAAVAGQQAALEELLRRHHDRLYAVCRRVTGDDGDAADATQNAMIAVVRSLQRFDGRASFSTWSHRIAVNAALDELRRRRRRPAVLGGAGLPGRPGEAAGGPRDLIDVADQGGARLVAVGDQGRTADLGDAVAARLDIDAALGCLPVEFRVAVVLRDLSGLSYVEIAEVLDVPVGTVRSRIARGRQALAAVLGSADLPGSGTVP